MVSHCHSLNPHQLWKWEAEPVMRCLEREGTAQHGTSRGKESFEVRSAFVLNACTGLLAQKASWPVWLCYCWGSKPALLDDFMKKGNHLLLWNTTANLVQVMKSTIVNDIGCCWSCSCLSWQFWHIPAVQKTAEHLWSLAWPNYEKQRYKENYGIAMLFWHVQSKIQPPDAHDWPGMLHACIEDQWTYH